MAHPPFKRVLAVVPHPDDFEFNIAGSFALLRQQWGKEIHLGILILSAGASGHHLLSPKETILRRQEEARKSARLIDADIYFLRGLDGRLIDTQVLTDRNLLGGLWNAIRRFCPDLIICPPVACDPLAGVHIDHEMTAQAMRLVAYQLAVPGAYPRLEGTDGNSMPLPLILNCDDSYHGPRTFHLRVPISSTYAIKEQMALCHESQIFEWLPFLDGNISPVSSEDFKNSFRIRHHRINERYGQSALPFFEYFQVTQWGTSRRKEQLLELFSDSQMP